MKLAHGYRPNSNQDRILIIKLPCSRILGVISKSLFLAIFIIALPSIGSYENHANRNEFLPMVFEDLVVEGLFKDGEKGLVLRSGIGDLFDGFWLLNDMGIDVVIDKGLGRGTVVNDEGFDFVFASSLENVEFVDRVVKVDGIVAMPLGKCYELLKSNYKIVYLRRFDFVTIVAMRKIDGEGEEGVNSG